MVGALACLFVGDWWGRRKVITWGVAIMIVGAIIQCTSYELSQLIVGRVITGIGNGMKTATIPMYQSVRAWAHLSATCAVIAPLTLCYAPPPPGMLSRSPAWTAYYD